MRGLLLAAVLPGDVSTRQFWDYFKASEPMLKGMRVHDPFAGGGTVLVEAARLGAAISGMDVDPLAVNIVRHELRPPSHADLRCAAASLIEFVTAKTAHLFAPTRRGWIPLHYFYIHIVTL